MELVLNPIRSLLRLHPSLGELVTLVVENSFTVNVGGPINIVIREEIAIANHALVNFTATGKRIDHNQELFYGKHSF